MTTDEYFVGPESNRPRELVFGVVREPPAPFPSHQGAVTRLASVLHAHTAQNGLGDVYVSPVDVVLDERRGLVLQPDIVFVAASNRAIVRDRIWGAPDLVIEVLSPRTSQRDRTTKLAWYREYLVRECWLVDPVSSSIEIVDCASVTVPAVYEGARPVRSRVLPTLVLSARDVLREDDGPRRVVPGSE